ncbi:unnamed protein product [Caenorhabditis angaria]|uniref:Uncharacterized protein n=1 Tax=Caenorhabditis angaria TaxID=860376 RepID=A0A9P1J207_9PELO|nr:unnamed protein product [Caenorhabditis angaria]
MDYIQQKEKLNKVIMELRRESCELELEAALHVLNECQNQLAPNVQPIKKKITKQVSWAESVDDTAQSSSTVKDAINHDENASKSEDDLKVQTKRNGESQDRLKLLELCIAQIKMEQSMDMDISTEPEKRVLFPIVEEEEEEERNDPIDTLDETVNVDGDIEQGTMQIKSKIIQSENYSKRLELHLARIKLAKSYSIDVPNEPEDEISFPVLKQQENIKKSLPMDKCAVTVDADEKQVIIEPQQQSLCLAESAINRFMIFLIYFFLIAVIIAVVCIDVSKKSHVFVHPKFTPINPFTLH